MKKDYCVISHTHWDREWYFTFEQFRYRLVKLMDNLLDIMEKQPRFIFHLDAQTIVLEDYLKIKPYNREKLEKYIKEGRIIAGPWYVQNDFFLTDGEATVRNLMIGSKIANSFGACGVTGYIPDQFGNISQLPQIFNSFGIETCLLGRGYTFFERDEDGKLKKNCVPAEFYWDSKDGSRVFSVRFTNWYNNAQRFSEDTQKNLRLMDHIKAMHGGTDRVPYYLLMNGVDHLEAQENLLDVLQPLNKELSDGTVYQCSMKEYTDKSQKYIEENNVPMNVMTGELRHGSDYDLLKGTLSSRVYLKIANFKAQNKIENTVEPLYAMAKAYGFEDLYPTDYLEYLWKLLIENHPHDSICGCSVDAVHRNMMDRTARFNEVANELTADALNTLTSHISHEGMNEEDYIISVWNTSEEERSDTCEIELSFPEVEKVCGFEIFDKDGNKAKFDVLKKFTTSMRTTSPINLPGEIDCTSYCIKLYAENVPAMGYKAYTLKKTDARCEITESCCDAKDIASIENDLFKVSVDGFGRIDVTDKTTASTYKDCINFSDTGDKGDLYVYSNIWQDAPIETYDKAPCCVTVLKNTELEKSISVKYILNLPESADFHTYRRSENTVENTVEAVISLIKGQKWIDINCKVDNKSKDHRLRILIDTCFSTDFTTSLVPFDVTERDRRDALKKICSDGTQPNSGLVYIGEDGKGVGILNEGLYEYEHLMGDKGTVAVTLMRCAGIITVRPDRFRRYMTQTFDSQCIGTYEMHLGLAFESGEKKQQISRLVRKSKLFSNKMPVCFQPYSIKKFTGGRPQVQDSDIAELFFRADKYENISLKKTGKIADVLGDAFTVSALKLSENGKMLVVRAYSVSDDCETLEVKPCAKVSQAFKLTMGEDKVLDKLEIKDNTVIVKAKPHEIVTIGFVID